MTNTNCPVCGVEIRDNGVKATVNGKEVTVCCEQCAKKAKESPTQYAGSSK